MALEDIIPSVSQADKAIKDKLDSNTFAALAEIFPDPVENLKAKLRARHITLGKPIGAGNVALVFEIIGNNERPLDSAIVRIEPAGSAGVIDNPGVIRPLLTVKSDVGDKDDVNFEAHILPRAKARDYKPNEVLSTFAALNAESKLSNVGDLNRPLDGQFMELPGVDIPVYTDLNAVSATGKTQRMGDVTTFAEAYGLDAQAILDTKMPLEELVKLRKQTAVLMGNVRQELQNNGINIAPVPNVVSDAAITPLLERGHEGHALQ